MTKYAPRTTRPFEELLIGERAGVEGPSCFPKLGKSNYNSPWKLTGSSRTFAMTSSESRPSTRTGRLTTALINTLLYLLTFIKWYMLLTLPGAVLAIKNGMNVALGCVVGGLVGLSLEPMRRKFRQNLADSPWRIRDVDPEQASRFRKWSSREWEFSLGLTFAAGAATNVFVLFQPKGNFHEGLVTACFSSFGTYIVSVVLVGAAQVASHFKREIVDIMDNPSR
jgi:hypothetical protein